MNNFSHFPFLNKQILLINFISKIFLSTSFLTYLDKLLSLRRKIFMRIFGYLLFFTSNIFENSNIISMVPIPTPKSLYIQSVTTQLTCIQSLPARCWPSYSRSRQSVWRGLSSKCRHKRSRGTFNHSWQWDWKEVFSNLEYTVVPCLRDTSEADDKYSPS